ncbi:MAG: YkgJ family cysteine cluster protein [Deltaproteobacteria bacterium]|nr:YkgJ family cysteine cluster protein [Deltaproteobacteria bacterium]MBW2020177.1 YkgJ family cysteine cluster protein [Deltaproteobacteria bacterium]MBW2075689.1 YkgJ family cysteine cluster protein [Deltaproteobacteria bacterium]RLB81765.1 MAG: YkgJ family cysteine cluster protein [Deltaproteobacteria bacterium]
MKYIDAEARNELLNKKLEEDEVFSFQCHEGLACFTRCCRNLNLFLYPYDVLRLKNRLNMSSDQFLDTYVDIVLRESNFFPDVLLRMSENEERTCPFLDESGCTVYLDRPDTCRTFPLEQGILFQGLAGKATDVYFFKPPDFCLGQYEPQEWTSESWAQDQDAVFYHKMTAKWAEVKALFRSDPWGQEGPYGPKAKMAFMATYSLDKFREFVFNSTFLRRYKVKSDVLRKIKTDDVVLMKFGFGWVKFFVWGMKVPYLRLR